MKILHTADIHLGVELYGHYDPVTGLPSRLQDFGAALDRAVDYALDHEIDLFLFAGDAYKTRDPSPTQQREFARRLRRLIEGGVPVFLLTGNHDMPNAVGRATSLDIYGTLDLPNLVVASRPDLYRVTTKSGPIQIVGVPWLTRSIFLSKEETKNVTLSELNNKLLERLEAFMTVTAGRLDPSIPAILSLHGAVAGATYDSDRSTLMGNELVVPKGLVQDPAFSYVALGHIHKHQVLATDPPIVYPGGLERIDFGEEHDAKGFVVIDLDHKPARWQFVESGARRFISIRIVASSDDPTTEVMAAATARDLGGAVVKLDVHLLDSNQSRFQEARVRSALRDVYHLSVVRTVDRAARQRGSGFSTAKGPLENLATYLERQAIPKGRSELLLDYARSLLSDDTDDGGRPNRRVDEQVTRADEPVDQAVLQTDAGTVPELTESLEG